MLRKKLENPTSEVTQLVDEKIRSRVEQKTTDLIFIETGEKGSVDYDNQVFYLVN